MTSTRLKKLMKERRISRLELAEKASIPIGTLNKIIYGETQNPSLNTMKAITEALDTTIEIFADTPDDNIIVRENGEEYYINKESVEIADEIYKRSDLKTLFEIAQTASPETVRLLTEFLKQSMKK